MLFGTNGLESQYLSFGYSRKRIAFAFVALFIIFAIGVGHRHLINTQIAIEFLHRTSGTERVIAGRNIDRGLIENRGEHLRSHEALPDQLV